MNQKVIIQLYPSPIINASRILRETESLIKLGIADKIFICGIGSEEYKEIEQIDKNRTIIRIRSDDNFRQLLNKGLIGRFHIIKTYIRYGIQVLKLVKTKKPQFITIRRVELLPLGFFAKIISLGRTKLIYSPHELESEREGIDRVTSFLFKSIEHIFIPFSTSVVVVNDAIRDWYLKQYYHKKIFSVTNTPQKKEILFNSEKKNILRKLHSIPNNHFIFLYQGLLTKSRGIDFLLSVFSEGDPNKHIVLMGMGPYCEIIRQYENEFSNIHFQKAVHPSEIVQYTSSADVGVFFLSGLPGLSYKLSLPNKFSEYLMAGLPVLVSSNLIFLSQIIEEKRLGWILESSEEKYFKSFLNNIDKKEIETFDKNIQKYISEIGWEFEEIKLLEIYH